MTSSRARAQSRSIAQPGTKRWYWEQLCGAVFTVVDFLQMSIARQSFMVALGTLTISGVLCSQFCNSICNIFQCSPSETRKVGQTTKEASHCHTDGDSSSHECPPHGDVTALLASGTAPGTSLDQHPQPAEPILIRAEIPVNTVSFQHRVDFLDRPPPRVTSVLRI